MVCDIGLNIFRQMDKCMCYIFSGGSGLTIQITHKVTLVLSETFLGGFLAQKHTDYMYPCFEET